MYKRKTRIPLTLFVHTDIAFEWYKTLISEFYRQGSQSIFSVKIVYRRQDIPSLGGPVVLVSVDERWINDNLQYLEKIGRKAILLSGIVSNKTSNVSRIIIDHDDLILKSIIHLRQCGRSEIASLGSKNRKLRSSRSFRR